MDPAAARLIIEALADGIDPRTGEVLPPGSPLDSADVVRALAAALAALDAQIKRNERNASPPSNAGKSWSDADDLELARLFDSGQPVAEIARVFERTRGAITSRLVRLGKLDNR